LAIPPAFWILTLGLQPRRPIDAVTTSGLPGFTEVAIAHPAQVSKANPFGVSPHLGNDLLDLGHVKIIPLLVPFVKWCMIAGLQVAELTYHAAELV
jgi:hypothetical protein